MAQQRKIFQVLRSLNKNEIAEFGKLMGSPCFRTDQYVVSLFKFLKKHYPGFDSPKLEESKVARLAFPKNAPDYPTFLNNKISKLIHLVEKYLILKRYEDNSGEKELILGKIYQERKEEDLMFKKLNGVKRRTGKNPVKTKKDMELLGQIHFGTYFNLKFPQFTSLDVTNFLTDAYLDHAQLFSLSALRISLECSMRKLQVEEIFDLPLINHVKEMSSYLKGKNPLIEIYYEIFLHTEKLDPQPLNRAEALFREFLHQIPPAERVIIMTMLINFVSFQINKGQKNYRRKAIGLYELAFAENCLEADGMISEAHFSNAIFLCVQEDKIDKAEDIMGAFSDKLPPEVKTNCLRVNKAHIAFAKNEFDNVLTLLQKTDFSNLIYDLNSRTLIAKAYYELNLKDHNYPLIDYCDSFYQYLKRHKTFHTLNRSFLFISVLKKMARAEPGKEDLLKRQLLYNLEGEDVVSREWLIEKIKGL